jgi:hypothetical protein
MSKVLVDRDLLERLMRADADMGREGSASFTLDASDRLDRAWAELRAILAKPEDPEGFEIARHSKRLVEQLRSDLSAVTAERDRLQASEVSLAKDLGEALRQQCADMRTIDQLRAEVEALRSKIGEPELFTCTGKGGVYEKVASALGAGPLRGQHFMVYRSETDYFVRKYEDFQDRMEPADAAMAAKEA